MYSVPFDAGQEIVVGVAVTQMDAEVVVDGGPFDGVCDGVTYGGGGGSSSAEDVLVAAMLVEEEDVAKGTPGEETSIGEVFVGVMAPGEVVIGVEYGAAPPMLDVPSLSLGPEYCDVVASRVDKNPEADVPLMLEDPNKGVLKLYRSLVVSVTGTVAEDVDE